VIGSLVTAEPPVGAGYPTGMTERAFAVEVVQRLQAAGHVALFAGGCVRDELLGLAPADYDVATSARPEQVQQLFRRTVAVGAAFGVVEVIGPKTDGTHLKVQVATFRSDGAYTDGRRPDAVTFATPEEDAARRDFTINGLFADPLTGEVRDYVGGRADLAAKVLRAIGDPAERFAEDKLRLLRAVRMAARFGLEIELATLAAIKRMAPQITVVSAERIADELRKLLAHPNRAHGLTLLAETGLLPVVLPEAAPPVRTTRVFKVLPRETSFPAALAVLLDGRRPTEAVAAGRRLRLSNEEIDRTAWLVDEIGTFTEAPSRLPSVVYPLLAHPAGRHFVALLRAYGAGLNEPGLVREADHCERLLRDKSPAELDPPPLVTGDDLRAAGHKPGPGFKPALAAARAAQLDGEVTTREQALALAARVLGGP
jgi:tRNA nucleotidyltransferase/poly(A) polymerase